MATKWDTVRDEWLLYVEAQYAAAEEATRGDLIRLSRRDEFGKKYGWRAVALMLFSDLHAAGAYYYASEELVDWWRAHPRLTWNEFAVQNGIRYRHVVRAALKAPGSRAAAEYRASCGRRSGRPGPHRPLRLTTHKEAGRTSRPETARPTTQRKES